MYGGGEPDLESQQHIVRTFDDQLKQLSDGIARMGGMAEAQLAAVIDALARRDDALAAKIVTTDSEIDRLEQDIHENAIALLTRHQPMAIDLREVISALKISSEIERIGDHVVNFAKRLQALNTLPQVQPVHSVPRMARLVQSILKDALDAYATRDAEKALYVWHRDQEVDHMYTSLFRELLTYMMEDPRSITPCIHLLFIAKNIERIGDHATNIAETIKFMVAGKRFTGERLQKSDFHGNAPHGLA